MKLAKNLAKLTAVAAAILASQASFAGENDFINSDWADHAWYSGLGLGQSHAFLNQNDFITSLSSRVRFHKLRTCRSKKKPATGAG